MVGGVHNHVWDLSRKGKFGPDSEKNVDQSCLFEEFESRVGDVLKKTTLVQIFLRIYTKLDFSNNLKVDQTCHLTYDQKFQASLTL